MARWDGEGQLAEAVVAITGGDGTVDDEDVGGDGFRETEPMWVEIWSQEWGLPTQQKTDQPAKEPSAISTTLACIADSNYRDSIMSLSTAEVVGLWLGQEKGGWGREVGVREIESEEAERARCYPWKDERERKGGNNGRE
jgi:hypothetical protein